MSGPKNTEAGPAMVLTQSAVFRGAESASRRRIARRVAGAVTGFSGPWYSGPENGALRVTQNEILVALLRRV